MVDDHLDSEDENISEENSLELYTNRCVLCMRRLGTAEQRIHKLDSSDTVSEETVTFATQTGVIAPYFGRLAFEEGILLCSSCHQDLFTPNLVFFCPPKEVLLYLIDQLKADYSRPIYKVLDQLVPWSSESERRHVLPFVDLYDLIALVPEELKEMDVAIYHDARALCLLNSWWNTVPMDATPDAWIYDSELIDFADPANPRILDLSGRARSVRRLWRLPPGKIGPILSSLFHRVSHLVHSESEEIRLAIELRNLLTPRSNGGLGPFGKSTSGIEENENGGRQKKQGQGRQGRRGYPETRRQPYGKESAEFIDRHPKAPGFMRMSNVRLGRRHSRIMSHLSMPLTPSPITAIPTNVPIWPAPPPVIRNPQPRQYSHGTSTTKYLQRIRPRSHFPIISLPFRGFLTHFIRAAL